MKHVVSVVLTALALVMALAHPSAANPPARMSSALVVRGINPGPTKQHLYVSDLVGQRIVRFPLVNGIPSPLPDAIIGGFQRPLGIAIGPNDGRLYVVDAGLKELFIFEPAPTSNSKPSHVLSLQNHALGRGAVAIDHNGFVYVGFTTWSDPNDPHPNANADIYTPLPSGSQSPMATVTWGDASGPFGLALNSNQELAAGLGGGPFSAPILGFASHMPRNDRFTQILPCAANVPIGVAWDSDVLYIADLGTNGDEPEIDVLPPRPRDCIGEYAITSATTPLTNPEGVAVKNGFLYATSGFNQQIGSALVFVFDPKISGAQTPKAILGGHDSRLKSAHDVAVGP